MNLPNILQSLVIIIYIVLITFSPTIHFISYIDFHDCQRIIQILLLGLVLLDGILIWLNRTGVVPINDRMRLGFLVLLFLAICSTILSIQPRYAIIEVTTFVALCYVALFVAPFYSKYKEGFVKKLSYAIIIGVMLNLFAFYVGYLSAMVSGRGLIWPEPIAGFSSVRVFNQYQLLTFAIICLPILAFSPKSNIRIWLYIVLGAWWGLLFYAASRGAIISWILAMVVTAIVYQKQAWPFLRIQLISALTGLLSYVVLFKLIPMWITPTSTIVVTSTIFRDTLTDRTDLWKMAYVMIKNFPILGVGPMNFYFYNNLGTHPHNSVLQIAAEWGLPITIIILTTITYAAKCWLKQFGPRQLPNSDHVNRQLAIILFFTMNMISAYSLVDGIIVMPISQVLIFTMIGLMIGQYSSVTLLSSNSEPQRKFHYRQVFAGVTLVFLLLSTMPEIIRGLTSYDRILQSGERAFSMAPNTINPRIWMQQRRIENN